MSTRAFLAGCLLVLAGCGKPAAPPPSPTVAGPLAPATPTEAPLAPASPSGSAVADEAQLAATLSELTQAVRKYGVEQQRVPKNLEEVAAAGYLTQLPAAPAGKKFAIDKKMQVYLSKP